MAGKEIKIGGMSFNADIVAGKKVVKDDKGNKMNRVTLKSGAIFEFYDQKTPGTVKGYTHRDLLFRKDNHLIVNGLQGGTITGSSAGDTISLNFCHGTSVNVRDGQYEFYDKGDKVLLDSNSKDIKVSTDATDEITYYDENGEKHVYDRSAGDKEFP